MTLRSVIALKMGYQFWEAKVHQRLSDEEYSKLLKLPPKIACIKCCWPCVAVPMATRGRGLVVICYTHYVFVIDTTREFLYLVFVTRIVATMWHNLE